MKWFFEYLLEITPLGTLARCIVAAPIIAFILIIESELGF